MGEDNPKKTFPLYRTGGSDRHDYLLNLFFWLDLSLRVLLVGYRFDNGKQHLVITFC